MGMRTWDPGSPGGEVAHLDSSHASIRRWREWNPAAPSTRWGSANSHTHAHTAEPSNHHQPSGCDLYTGEATLLLHGSSKKTRHPNFHMHTWLRLRPHSPRHGAPATGVDTTVIHGRKEARQHRPRASRHPAGPPLAAPMIAHRGSSAAQPAKGGGSHRHQMCRARLAQGVHGCRTTHTSSSRPRMADKGSSTSPPSPEARHEAQEYLTDAAAEHHACLGNTKDAYTAHPM